MANAGYRHPESVCVAPKSHKVTSKFWVVRNGNLDFADVVKSVPDVEFV